MVKILLRYSFYLTIKISVFVLIGLSNLYAQEQGNIEIIAAPGINTILEKHIAFNENLKGFPGYRIQIFFDSGNNSKFKANLSKQNFMAKYPDVQAYILYQEPYYKVRVGDFRTRLDAKRFFQQIANEYQNAFIVPDEINFPAL